MEDLERYVSEDLREDESIVRELSDCIDRALNFFNNIEFVETAEDAEALPALWPYWVLDRDRKRHRGGNHAGNSIGRLSQSTTSMIVAAIDTASNLPRNGRASGYRWTLEKTAPVTTKSEELERRLLTAVKHLEIQWCQNWTKGEGKGHATSSSTFGLNDILTLSWHLDIFHPKSQLNHTSPEAQRTVYEQAQKILDGRIRLFGELASGHEGVLRSFAEPDLDGIRIILDSAYNLLRFVRCFPHRSVEILDDELTRAKDRAFYRFQSRLHDHLSFSGIVYGRFDPSELTFCLEGMLQLRPDSVNDSLFERVISVLEKAQQTSPYWTSDTPILGDKKGQVLYPISVEIVRSLLSSISIFDQANASTGLGSASGFRAVQLVKRYWKWLATRQTSVKTEKGIGVSGWMSELINDPAVVHTWETSQILDFCLTYRDQMRSYISRKLLLASRLDIKWPKRRANDWSTIENIYEPVSCLDEKAKIFNVLGEKLVKPHLENRADKYWSALLYGPPGTGKSDLAEIIAGHLQLPMITITVSDFLAAGEAGMENRAKLVFDVLMRQTPSVVLFDEMDQFLLNRDSKRFSDQDSVFQFLTPGMLTKFANLKKKANVIFFVATNYEERIDPAITRRGRLDMTCMILPPDTARRLQLLESFENIGRHIKEASKTQRAEIGSASAFLCFKDLEDVASTRFSTHEDLHRRLDSAPRNIQFFGYKNRFSYFDSGDQKGLLDLNTGPRSELLCLFGLANDAWSDPSGGWNDQRTKSYECGKAFIGAFEKLLKSAERDSKKRFLKDLKTIHQINIEWAD